MSMNETKVNKEGTEIVAKTCLRRETSERTGPWDWGISEKLVERPVAGTADRLIRAGIFGHFC